MSGHNEPGAVTPDGWKELVEGFEELSLTREQWTHAAHLLVTLDYALTSEDIATLVGRMREGIKALNEANGVPMTPTGGYHETITVAFAHMVWQFARSTRWAAVHEGTTPFYERYLPLAEAIVSGELMDRKAPLRFYSRDRINSVEARYGFVEPDVAPLPTE